MTMNNKQRKVLVVTAWVIALMVLIPPYEVTKEVRGGYGGYKEVVVATKYGGCLFDLPGTVAKGTLFAQVFGALLVGGLVFLAKGKTVEDIEEEEVEIAKHMDFLQRK